MLAVFVALVLASFAAPGVATAADSLTEPGTIHSYAYDSHPHPAGPTYTTMERGPPATYNDATIYNADGLWSLGASAHPNPAAIRATYDSDDLAWVLQTSRGSSRGGQGRVANIEADLAAVERSRVAANGVTRTCRTNSFTGATLVLMADGTRKPIKDVKLGG